MKILMGTIAVAALALTQACSTAPKAPDVAGGIKDALKAAGLKDVSVTQDRDKGVVTLKGSVAAAPDKAQAESIARSLAAGQVVGNEIAILPPGGESTAKAINSDLDDGIKKNLDAALIASALKDQVKYDVKNGVVTLTGQVNSQASRGEAQRIATAVPNVQQVVNKLDVKNQKATSSD
jgi:hyperosmotically inducible periplasmic protein